MSFVTKIVWDMMLFHYRVDFDADRFLLKNPNISAYEFHFKLGGMHLHQSKYFLLWGHKYVYYFLHNL